MEKSLQEQFECLLKIKTDNLDVFADATIKLLELTTVKDSFLLSKIGPEMRNVDKQRKNLVCSEKYFDYINKLGIENFIQNKFVMSPFTWCAYNIKIQGYQYIEDTYDEFIKWAEIIVNNCIQLPLAQTNKTPYVITILKVIKTFRKKLSVSHFQLLSWVEKLNPDELSEECYQFTDEKGKERELASPKEIYYQTKSKCLERLKRYEDAANCCEIALKTLTNWHYRNDLWLSARKWYCKCKATQDDESLTQYIAIAEKQKFWYMYHKIGNLFLSNGDIEKAKYYLCKAISADSIDPEKMINLFYDLGMIWEINNRKDFSKTFYQAAYYYREKYRWSIDENLQFAQYEYQFDIDKCLPLKDLQKIGVEYIVECDKLIEGKITAYNHNDRFGFITSGNQSIRFIFKVTQRRLRINDKVYFKCMKLNNGKIVAENIYKIGD